MTRGVIVDSGPIVAYFLRRDAYHAWAVAQFSSIYGTTWTCEAVITESCFLLSHRGIDPARLLDCVIDGSIGIEFCFHAEAQRIRELMVQYRDQPMSFADACLVRMAETTGLPICTLDADFQVYRKHGRETLTIISP